MTQDFKNLIMKKIEKPTEGWTVTFLGNYGFNFFANPIIKANAEIVRNILNQYLPYFYFAIPTYSLDRVNTITSNTISRSVIVEKTIALEIETISKQTTMINQKKFNKSILTYKSFVSGYNDLDVYMSNAEKEWNRLQRLAKKSKSQSFAIQKRQTSNTTDHQINGDKGGIYRLYSIDKNNIEKTLYIGLTTRDFEERWNEHKNILYGQVAIPDGMHKLYNLLKEEYEYGQIFAEAIIEFNKLQINRPLSQKEKEAMELAAITLFKPIGNTAGIDVPYYFSDGPKNINKEI